MTFDEIYFEHQKMVFNLALQYLQNIEDAEEVMQDVFVKVHDHLNAFKNQSSLKTWIYRITINQSLDFIKAKKTQKRSLFSNMLSLDDSTIKYEPTNFKHPGIELEQRESYKMLFDAINQLSDNQKTAIILLKIEDKSQAETAEIMNLNIKALESLFQRAKKNLEILLNPKGHR
ncbi:MAG: RNA polymerase sigma factor [Bacteroidetes bacterium]|nr:RNA polymerase sigma factor [Bacteroidota bacterium]